MILENMMIDDNHNYFDLYEIDPREYLEDK